MNIDWKAVPATDPRVSWMGRTGCDGEGVQLGFPGIAMTVRFKGSTLALDIESSIGENHFDLSIDTKLSHIVQLSPINNPQILAHDLDPTKDHTLELIRRNEAWQGTCTIKSLLLPPDGEVLSPPLPPQRKLLFIGDSITCGAGVNHLAEGYPEGAICSDANRSFGMELGRRLNSQVHLVSYGGRGLIRDYLGQDDSITNNVRLFFERAMPDDPDSFWEHSKYQPDGIVICLGTNDFNVSIPDEGSYVDAYTSFIGRIHELHPEAPILLVNSPVFNRDSDDGKFAALDRYLSLAIKACATKGLFRIEKLNLSYQPGTPQDGHPTGPQHLQIASEIEPVLRRMLHVS